MNYSLKQIKNHYLVKSVEVRRDVAKTYKITLKCGEVIEEMYLRDVSLILRVLEMADK
ncbi:MAG: hypothetical protein ACRDDY_03310 [Clostridium sp.]|uniref:hypothetical protein n=1 Tax=Clostridium sp. TaxID=1506 RepID=UPI003EE744EE